VKQFDWLETLGRPLLAALVMGGVVWALSGALPFLAVVALGVAVYGLAALLFGAVGREDVSFLRRARRGTPETPPVVP